MVLSHCGPPRLPYRALGGRKATTLTVFSGATECRNCRSLGSEAYRSGVREPATPDSTMDEEKWRENLLRPSRMRWLRRFMGHIPTGPRCKSCTRPFGGPGGVIMRAVGLGPWSKNSKYCTGCFKMLRRSHGGAEIETSLLFADVRGSTSLAEEMTPRDFTRLMGRFYDTATEVLIRHDAIVDKFVGDEVIGIFIPGLAGESHARRAVDAARELLKQTGHGRSSGPWVPVGVGVNTGQAYVGAIGEGPDRSEERRVGKG